VTAMKTLSAMCVLVVAVTIAVVPSVARGAEQPNLAQELLSIGQLKPSAIGLRVWTESDSSQVFREGSRLIISVQASRDAYLTALSVSSTGDVSIIFPNKHTPDPFVQKGETYTLFGDDSPVRLTLGNLTDTPRLALYVSSQKLKLEGLTPSKQTGVITIPAKSTDAMKSLKTALEAAATGEGFNRVVVSPMEDGKHHFEIVVTRGSGRLMGGERPTIKKLPTSVESAPPETVTGVQGVKPEQPE
jgi:hypothetical protein